MRPSTLTLVTWRRKTGTPFVQGSCYLWNGPSYDTAGCEDFGASLLRNAVKTTYRWLVADPLTPEA
jgi:hypothetical protein